MKKTKIICLASFLTISLIAVSQSIPGSETGLTVEKAKYLKGNVTGLLSGKTKYPNEPTSSVQGDVVLAFNINRNGILDSLSIISSPDFTFSTSAVLAINSLDGQWSPAKLNDIPVDSKYRIVFRYRKYLNSKPIDFKGQAEALYKKGKYEKALKAYDRAIKDNEYDAGLYESRSRIREMLGDTPGTKQDLMISNNLKNEIMSVVNVNLIGVSHTSVVVHQEIRVVPVNY
jgi:hypothetical protein